MLRRSITWASRRTIIAGQMPKAVANPLRTFIATLRVVAHHREAPPVRNGNGRCLYDYRGHTGRLAAAAVNTTPRTAKLALFI